MLYDGGPWGTIFIPMVSVAHTTAFWVAANGCNSKPVTEISDVGLLITDTFVDGAEGAVVQLHTIVDGGHEWFRRPNLDATQVIWDFFTSLSGPAVRRQ